MPDQNMMSTMILLPKYDLPTNSFPFKIPHRLTLLSYPKKQAINLCEGMPPTTEYGVRQSALSKGHIRDRITDIAWPKTRRLFATKRCYKHRLDPKRLEWLDKLIELSNATCYTKLANAVTDLKKQNENKAADLRKKKAWSEGDWKKHMDYISTIAAPKKLPEPEPVDRGPVVALEDILPKLNELAEVPESRLYRRMSEEPWYRDPTKVSPNAMKYITSERIKELAKPRVPPSE